MNKEEQRTKEEDEEEKMLEEKGRRGRGELRNGERETRRKGGREETR